MPTDKDGNAVLTWRQIAGAMACLAGVALSLAVWAGSLAYQIERNSEEIQSLEQADRRIQLIVSDLGALTERSRANADRLIRIEKRIDVLINYRRAVEE